MAERSTGISASLRAVRGVPRERRMADLAAHALVGAGGDRLQPLGVARAARGGAAVARRPDRPLLGDVVVAVRPVIAVGARDEEAAPEHEDHHDDEEQQEDAEDMTGGFHGAPPYGGRDARR